MEREARKNNLMIFNLAESDRHAPDDRYKEDDDRCQELFAELGVETIGVENVIILGKKVANRVRPFQVELSDGKFVRDIKQSKSNMKNIAKFKKVLIDRDMSSIERDKQEKEMDCTQGGLKEEISISLGEDK